MRHLNMWHRLGVVLSVLWVLAFGTYLYSFRTDKLAEALDLAREVCRYNRSIQVYGDFPNCVRSVADMATPIVREGVWFGVVTYTLLPLLVAWVAAYAVRLTWRWVLAGRGPKTAASNGPRS